MKTLVLGSGGREHAIAWKLAEEIGRESLWIHPGNGGTAALGFQTLDLEHGALVPTAAKETGIELAIIGPEVLLADGLADRLRESGILVVGPGQEGALLESSKVFSKEFMTRAKIPTAPYRVVESQEELKDLSIPKYPIVLKLDGLAAGKGVVIAQDAKEVEAFGKRVWKDRAFGTGPHRLLVEENLVGNELSYIGFCDGETFIPMASATDYKRIGENNTGPNTGGMGSISPSPYLTKKIQSEIDRQIVEPFIAQLKSEKIAFRGILFIGVMVTAEGIPFVLEFNTRFGDPETQAVLMRLESSFLEVLTHTAKGTLSACSPLRWSDEQSLYVVAASEGYPTSSKTGDPIEGIENLPKDVQLFFSGVDRTDDTWVTAGGRVLGLGALAKDRDTVRTKVYDAMKKINWSGMQYRHDIGAD